MSKRTFEQILTDMACPTPERIRHKAGRPAAVLARLKLTIAGLRVACAERVGFHESLDIHQSMEVALNPWGGLSDAYNRGSDYDDMRKQVAAAFEAYTSWSIACDKLEDAKLVFNMRGETGGGIRGHVSTASLVISQEAFDEAFGDCPTPESIHKDGQRDTAVKRRVVTVANHLKHLTRDGIASDGVVHVPTEEWRSMADGFGGEEDHIAMYQAVVKVFSEMTTWNVFLYSKPERLLSDGSPAGPLTTWIRFSMPGPIGQR